MVGMFYMCVKGGKVPCWEDAPAKSHFAGADDRWRMTDDIKIKELRNVIFQNGPAWGLFAVASEKCCWEARQGGLAGSLPGWDGVAGRKIKELKQQLEGLASMFWLFAVTSWKDRLQRFCGIAEIKRSVLQHLDASRGCKSFLVAPGTLELNDISLDIHDAPAKVLFAGSDDGGQKTDDRKIK